ncbi:unnamed protein product [Linum trigynum]|uniref:NAC domain-containing protein n=1 Tax=Linum trigynum TaxID=586398 RepID=A0AAV2F0X8_9ROSI
MIGSPSGFQGSNFILDSFWGLASAQLSSSGAWILDGKSIARKVTQSPTESIKDAGASLECPNCQHRIDNSDVINEWPGFPAGVKFAPTDAELLEHLAEKCGIGSSKPHMFIDEFIPTLEGDNGICYSHPENLPGAKKDGSCVHFFHRTMNAYATGDRKRRKIQRGEDTSISESVRWHKTGRTKVVVENGAKKGCKKIMVLYRSSKGRGSKPDKAGWTMHQFHLGTEEDETAGEYVVSRIFYQESKMNGKNNDETSEIQGSETVVAGVMHPRTPNPNPPNPQRHNDLADDTITSDSSAQDQKLMIGEDVGYEAWLGGESQPVDETPDFTNIGDSSLVCKETSNPSTSIFGNNSTAMNHIPCTGGGSGNNNPPFASSIFGNNSTAINHIPCPGEGSGNNNAPSYGISVLENLEMDTPPDFQLSDLQFGSQDSNCSWLDKF